MSLSFSRTLVRRYRQTQESVRKAALRSLALRFLTRTASITCIWHSSRSVSVICTCERVGLGDEDISNGSVLVIGGVLVTVSLDGTGVHG